MLFKQLRSSSNKNQDVKKNLDAILRGIQENKILKTFDKYYHKDVVMYEKGDSTNRVGKVNNRIAEKSFAKNAKIHELKVLKVLIDGDNTAYESEMTFTYSGTKITKTQWALQQWKDGLIIKEEFY
ncbi:hypothetical protein CYY_010094 [Polysphondylium violaceum]|uniref:SnoaL-like domain-containing protein n=1 Tax=Polysphondylium violaceum TaxID=133409 RepID=A0A8J4V2A5_9MYCE|nr:hypothetical protein CYY_010094 [Polysphondylium violaceum]